MKSLLYVFNIWKNLQLMNIIPKIYNELKNIKFELISVDDNSMMKRHDY